MTRRAFAVLVCIVAITSLTVQAGSAPQRARLGMVISQSDIASQIGFDVIKSGGNAIDAVVATGFALAVTHPTAGNIGGGGFIVYRPASGEPAAYDFREVGPSRSSPEMWLTDGKYDFEKHHNSHLAVGVPGTVAGLHMAWKEAGSKPWKELVEPAIKLARDGFEVSHGLARSLAGTLPRFKRYPASLAQFSKNGRPYEQGDILKQPDLARSLRTRAGAAAVLLTRGNRGMLLADGEGVHGIPIAGSTEIVDPSGAGDTVVSTATMARLAGATHLEAAHLANIAASISVMKAGAQPVTLDELREAVARR